MSEFKSDLTASECIGTNMAEFADYTIWTKLPNVDGLKPVQRRILWKLHTSPDFKKPGKEASLVGEVMKMHPHGDASIADAITTMSQPFSHIVPLVYSDSNIGAYSNDGKGAAAMRYVDVCESEAARSLFFGDINENMLHMIPCESELGVEPAYLVPRIPTALMIPAFGIAIGCRSGTSVLGLAELCELTKKYIKLHATHVDWRSKLKPLIKYMLPDFPTYCHLRNGRQLLNAYAKGEFTTPILVDGVMKLKATEITFETLPPDKGFASVTFDVGKMWHEKNTWENQNFQQMEDFSGQEQGIMRGQFSCILRRGINPFDVLKELKKRVQFTSAWKPIPNYVDERGYMKQETPLSILDRWYNLRYAVVLGDLKQKLKAMVDRQRELLALIIVVDHTDEVYKIFKSASNEEATIDPLSKKFGLTRFQARYLSGLKLSQITAKGKDELKKDLEDIKQKMRELQDKFSRVNELMIESIEKFEKDFVKQYPRRCTVPEYVGYACYRGNGYWMLESLEEMDEVLKCFDPDLIDFTVFPNKNQDIVGLEIDDDYVGDVPKYFKAGGVWQNNGETCTAGVVKGGGALVSQGIKAKTDNMSQAVPIYKTGFTYITKRGEVKVIPVDDSVMRKNFATGPTIRDAVFVSNAIPTVNNDLIVIHASTSQPNYLVIERVKANDKLHKIVIGDWYVIAVVPSTELITMINVPKEIRSRCNVRHIVFENIGNSIQLGQRKGCLFGRGTAALKTDYTMSAWRRKSTIMLAKPM